MRIIELTEEFEGAYTEYLLKASQVLLYVSNQYRKLIKSFVQGEDCYWLALDDNGAIIGVLPSFIMRNKEYGNVLNSLPFYGSNGAIIEHENNEEVKKMLLNAFYTYAHEQKCVAATIITSPFEEHLDFYEKNISYTHKDHRIGQITPLPTLSDEYEKELMQMFANPRPRNIRKAIKSGVQCSINNSPEAIAFLFKTHKDNIESINGISKPQSFFDTLEEYLKQNICDIYIAECNGEWIAALLIFKYNKTIEYFTPVICNTHRNLQPLALLVFEAMKDAITHGYAFWNWGGTWLTQDGVYNYKKKWGTVDYSYYYYTSVYDTSILEYTAEQLLAQYPYYYVLPFSALHT